MLGFSEIAIIVFIIVLLFGARRLPALGRAIGESVRHFKKAAEEPKVRDIEEIPK